MNFSSANQGILIKKLSIDGPIMYPRSQPINPPKTENNVHITANLMAL